MPRPENFSTRPMLDKITRLLYQPEINEESQKRIQEIKDFLKNNHEYIFIIYFNHISLNDPAVVLHLAEQISPEGHNQHLLAPVSYSHADTSKLEGKIFQSFNHLINKASIETVPIIQNYQIDDEKYRYTQNQADATYFKYLRRLKELKKSNIQIGVLISPEGHRSEDGQLSEGEKGVIATGKILAPVVYVPAGIHYINIKDAKELGNYKRNSFNPGRKMAINVGEITQQEHYKDEPSLEELMKKLALALPEKMRGVWQ